MGLIAEFRSRLRTVVVPVLWVAGVGYFAYHAVQGDRGLIAWVQLKQRVAETRVITAETAGRRLMLERRVRMLNPDSLDADLLDERARVMLNLGYPDEIIIPLPGPGGQGADRDD